MGYALSESFASGYRVTVSDILLHDTVPIGRDTRYLGGRQYPMQRCFCLFHDYLDSSAGINNVPNSVQWSVRECSWVGPSITVAGRTSQCIAERPR
jgi:hypothetical protein